MMKLFRSEVLSTLVMLVGVFSFRSSIAEPYQVPTGSMMPTILPGDYLVVSKLAYDLKLPFTDYKVAELGRPQRGDIVVFKYPIEPSINYVKRLIGLPGDEVEVTDGLIKINGKALEMTSADRAQILGLADDPAVAEVYQEQIGATSHLVQRLRHFPSKKLQRFRVPDDHYFFMGDNRDNSSDGRVWGFVPRAYLKGKALAVWLSLDSEHGSIPKVRWQRFGDRL